MSTPRKTASTSTTTQDNAPRSIADIIESFGRMMTAKELAPLLAMSKSTLYDRTKAGTIPSTSIGGSDIRYDPYLIAQWLRGRTA